jgi:hypothetical protein
MNKDQNAFESLRVDETDRQSEQQDEQRRSALRGIVTD